MTLKEIMTVATKSRGYTQSTFANELGIKQQSYSDRISKGSMRVDNLIEMLDKLGYEVIIKDKRNGSKAGTMLLNGIEELVEE